MLTYPHRENHITSNRVVDVVLTNVSIVVEPVTLAEVKNYLKTNSIADVDEDALTTDMITEAREWVEKRCGISLIAKTASAILELYNRQELPYGPVITNDPTNKPIVVKDKDGIIIDLSTINCSPRLLGADFPRLIGQGQFTVTYWAGYTVVPVQLKQAIMAKVASSYEHRGDEVDKNTALQSADFDKIAKIKSNLYRRTVGF